MFNGVKRDSIPCRRYQSKGNSHIISKFFTQYKNKLRSGDKRNVQLTVVSRTLFDTDQNKLNML